MWGGERKEEDLKQEYTDESMMAAGFTILDIWEMLGVSMFSWEGMREMERKEEVLVWHCTNKSEDLLLSRD